MHHCPRDPFVNRSFKGKNKIKTKLPKEVRRVSTNGQKKRNKNNKQKREPIISDIDFFIYNNIYTDTLKRYIIYTEDGDSS